MDNKTQKGFTLLELIIVVATVAILATVAMPAYQQHLTKTRRLDATTALLDLANRMERYYTQHQTYATATLGTGNTATDVLADTTSPQGWYELSITENSATTYTLQATPQKQQATTDLLCQSFTLTHIGEKGITLGSSGIPLGTVSQCWV